MRWCFVALVLALVACGRTERGDGPPSQPVRLARAATAADSNIAARDYIGSDACGECHPDQHAQWKTSLHRVMNQQATAPAALVGNFADATVAYAGGVARFTTTPEPTMELSRDRRTVRYRITRTIGVKRLQEYVGVAEGSTEEVRLPFGYWPVRGAWYPQAYFDPWLDEDDVDPYAEVKEPWAERCPWCHSTYPFELRIARATGRTIGHGFEQFFTSKPAGDRLAVASQVSVGISCESCHLGGRAHRDGAAIHFVPIGATALPGAPAPTTFTEERADAAIVNRVCAQCHSGPSPRFPDGGALRNSSEALDLAASSCTTARCVDCHDPHTGGSDDARAITACKGCHEVQSASATHAGDGHATTSCLDCHMPKIVMGVDRYVRTHRIGSPSDRAMLAASAPNACNLCHLDRSLGWTLDELRVQHDVAFDPKLQSAIDRDTPAGLTWLAAKEPGIRLVAVAAFARSPTLARQYAMPLLFRGLDDPLPYVRTWTQIAVEQLLGRRLDAGEYDARAPAPQRGAQATLLERAWQRR